MLMSQKDVPTAQANRRYIKITPTAQKTPTFGAEFGLYVSLALHPVASVA